MSIATTTLSAVAVAEAGIAAAADHADTCWENADAFERAEAAAFRLASVYPIDDDTVEVTISPAAVAYAVVAFSDSLILTGQSIAESAATVILDTAAERMRVPLSRGRISTVAPGVLRLTW